jgi:SdpC family antimicrobial peptide
MKTIKKSKKAVAYFLSLTILYFQFVSCSVDTNIKDIENYTPKEVFKGIIFLEGKFAEEVPTLRNLKVQQRIMYENAIVTADRIERGPSIFGGLGNMSEENQQVAEYFTEEIEKINPDFFSDFHTALVNGDPDEIRDYLRETGQLIQIVLIQSEKMQQMVNLLELAKSDAGIDINDYDLTNQTDVANFNDAITNFAQNHPDLLDIDSSRALAVVLIVVAWAFAALGVLAAVGMFGVVVGAYFVAGTIYVLLHNQIAWSNRDVDGIDATFLENQLIADLIEYYQN